MIRIRRIQISNNQQYWQGQNGAAIHLLATKINISRANSNIGFLNIKTLPMQVPLRYLCSGEIYFNNTCNLALDENRNCA